VHRVFDTIRPLPALLQVRCHAVTNIRSIMSYDMINHVINDFYSHTMHIISVKKNPPREADASNKQPKTELDVKFLAIVENLMSKQGIATDRAMSIALGRSENFLNRVRNGYQSATPEAWTTLRTKFPAAAEPIDAIINHFVTVGTGQTVGVVHGDNHYSPTTLDACQLELEQHKRDLAASRGEVEQLRQQVASQAALLETKDTLLASKDEIISLLRGGYNRPT
jgi:ElaB/YqjD/DUF883 family membrane-anchored ribosome-binding protein